MNRILLCSLLALTTCNQKNAIEASEQVRQPELEQRPTLTSKQFNEKLQLNQTDILFLDFWDGMSEEEYSFAIDKLKADGKISQDILPDGVPQDFLNKGYSCAQWITDPYYTFHEKQMDIRATLHPTFDSLNDKTLITIALSLAHDYNDRHFNQDNSMLRFCTVPNRFFDAMLRVYSSKYGTPSVETKNDIYYGYYKVYTWVTEQKRVIINKTISEYSKDHDDRPILENCSINYWSKATYEEMQKRKKGKIELEKKERSLKEKQTKDNI
jgi:hypothetical protein